MQEAACTLTDLDFQQESLDFSSLTPAEFEGLIFHLVDEMGFSNLTWRKGGDGNSANDGGRDITATYWRVDPFNSTEELYWFEVKYRTGQLPRNHVQDAVLAASASSDLSHLVVVTNSTVSNPCLDWIREFRSKSPRPAISVWQGHDLELLLRKNPRTLARFLPTALTFHGRCKIISSRLRNLFLLPSEYELVELWENRAAIEGDIFVLLAAFLAEAASGDLNKRPWGMWLSRANLLAVTVTAMVNLFPFVSRMDKFGRDHRPLVTGLVYLVACILLRVGHSSAADILYDPERAAKLELRVPREQRLKRIRPILAILYDQLATYCSADSCRKLSYREGRLDADYFARFKALEESTDTNRSFLTMNSTRHECEINLVPLHEYCPLADDILDEPLSRSLLLKRLAFAEELLKRRSSTNKAASE